MAECRIVKEAACEAGPKADPELTRDELLDLLSEECAEVIVAISKARRFGFTTMWPGYGRNDYAIAREVGDVLGVLDALNVFSWNEGVLPQSPLMNARRNKIEKARAMKRVMLDRLIAETKRGVGPVLCERCGLWFKPDVARSCARTDCRP